MVGEQAHHVPEVLFIDLPDLELGEQEVGEVDGGCRAIQATSEIEAVRHSQLVEHHVHGPTAARVMEIQAVATMDRVEHALRQIARPFEEIGHGSSIAAARNEVDVRVRALVRRLADTRTAQPDRHPSHEPNRDTLIDDQVTETLGLRVNVAAARLRLLV